MHRDIWHLWSWNFLIRSLLYFFGPECLFFPQLPKKVVSQLHIDRNRNRNSEDCADPKPTIVKEEIPTDFSPLHQYNSPGALLQADLLPWVVDQFRAEITEFRDDPLFYFCFFLSLEAAAVFQHTADCSLQPEPARVPKQACLAPSLCMHVGTAPAHTSHSAALRSLLTCLTALPFFTQSAERGHIKGTGH